VPQKPATPPPVEELIASNLGSGHLSQPSIQGRYP
jgi:hypothetical protein